MTDKDIVTIDKFSNDNFEFWKFSMSLLFEKKEIIEVVNGELKQLDKTKLIELRIWRKKDSDARYCIASTVDKLIIKHIHAKEM